MTGPLMLLRVLGLAVAVLLVILAVRRFRRRSLRLTDTIIMLTLAVGLGIVSVNPAAVDPFLTELGFPPGDARRVIGVLVISNVLVLILLLRAFAKTERVEQRLGDYADRIASRFIEKAQGAGEGTRDHAQKIAVVIPAFNEEGSIERVLPAVPRELHGIAVEPIVVSDGSDDATEAIARDHGAVVVPRDLRRGQGAAVALGYRVALLRDADIVATVDADGQYNPAELPDLVKPILDGDADVVHGSRALGAYERPLFGRAQGLVFFAWLTSFMSRTRITDPASGFRAFRREVLDRLEFRENQFHASEVTVAAAKSGFRVKEVPCTFRERAAGSSKKPPMLRYGYGYARSLLKTWLG